MNLALIREKENCIQQRLAEQVGVTRQMISAIENNVACPSPEVAQKIAEVLHFEKYGIHWSELLKKQVM